jgi:hypothetical protein
MRARPSAWLTSRLHARRVVKRLPSKSRRSDAGDCFRSLRFLQAAIHVLDAEAKKLCVMAWWWTLFVIVDFVKYAVKFLTGRLCVADFFLRLSPLKKLSHDFRWHPAT